MRFIGKFEIDHGKWHFGELLLDGRRTLLKLVDDQMVPDLDVSQNIIRGLSNDLVKLTLLECLEFGSGPFNRLDQTNWQADFLPHFVVVGDEYLTPSEKQIKTVSFQIEDSDALFFDSKAFGRVSGRDATIQVGANANQPEEIIECGPNSEIVYFKGKLELFRGNTEKSSVYAKRTPHLNALGNDEIKFGLLPVQWTPS